MRLSFQDHIGYETVHIAYLTLCSVHVTFLSLVNWVFSTPLLHTQVSSALISRASSVQFTSSIFHHRSGFDILKTLATASFHPPLSSEARGINERPI